MTGMEIPAGYAVLTGGLTLLSIVALIAAGWSRKKTAVLAALGVCTATSIFVIDVISDGKAMEPRLALILVVAAVVMIAPWGIALAAPKRRGAKQARGANPPDPASSTVSG